MTGSRIQIGISACVAGEKVRFDSGHKESRFVTGELSRYFSLLPVCPEIGIGLPVPRPTIRLISDRERVALVEGKNQGRDYTERMTAYAKNKVAQLERMELCGYIVCAKSPTCGMERVKVYREQRAEKDGVGLYTAELIRQMPWLPVEEDGRLNDPCLRENFVARVYALRDYYDSVTGDSAAQDSLCSAPGASSYSASRYGASRYSPARFISFHSRYKLLLMAHDPVAYGKLGNMVARIRDYEPDEFFRLYRATFMQALSRPASRKNNTNVMMHIQGYFKKYLLPAEKQELAGVIAHYRTGELPILAPLTLLKHYLSLHPDRYLRRQAYFEPYPQALRLRYSL